MTEPQRKRAPAKRKVRRELVRGEPIVQRVLAATVDELARAGYKALRVEDVAVAAGVNKTTVYRRWPEKAALVRDALWTFARDAIAVPDTGSLRGDMLALGRTMAELFASSRGTSVARMLVGEGADPEVADIKKAMRSRHEATPRAVIAAAVARGELSPDGFHLELFVAFMGAIHQRLIFMGEAVDEAFLVRLVDLLLQGALRCPPRPREGEAAGHGPGAAQAEVAATEVPPALARQVES